MSILSKLQGRFSNVYPLVETAENLFESCKSMANVQSFSE
jgi:hypothetical protein